VKLLAVLAVAVLACKGEPSKVEPLLAPPPGDRIPLANATIAIDGEWKEPAWNQRALRGMLSDDAGGQARPYSEVRLLHGASSLYVGLYAADEDIRSSERWELAIGSRTLHVDATGHADDPEARVAVDRDGTLDHPDDYDEEWVIEVQLPLDTSGEPLPITAKRCDTPKDGRMRCGQWHAQLRLE
jgi:hypothetical protein